jgi:hypothetical protein
VHHDLLHVVTIAVSVAALLIGCFDGDGARRRRVVVCDAAMIAAMVGVMLAPGSSTLALALLVAGALLNAAMVARASRSISGGGPVRDCMQSLAMILMAALVVAGGSGSSPGATADAGAHGHGGAGALVPMLVVASAAFAMLSIVVARLCFRSRENRDGAHHATMGAAVLAMGAGALL